MRRAVVLLIAGIAIGCVGSGALASASATSDQALRACVDRWNQGNMLTWGPALVSVSIRRLDASERAGLGEQKPGRPRCTVSLAEIFPRDSRDGCGSGAAVMPGHPKSCLDGRTWACVMNGVGGYDCPVLHEPPGLSIRNKNATTDKRGVLTLDVPLAGTHATPPLAWQRLYPHVDGFIHPWTRTGKLRTGLTFYHLRSRELRHYHGSCIRGSEISPEKSALKCNSDVRLDPCFPPPGDWDRRGMVVACGSPGYTSFGRFVITERS